jgi:hypothetical protein
VKRRHGYYLLLIGILSLGILGNGYAQEGWQRVINLRGSWNFSIGDNKRWADPKFDDSDWESIDVPSRWEDEGFNGYDGYAWYRRSFDGDDLEDRSLTYSLFLGYIDDVDEVYINGRKIGFSGTFPPRYRTAYTASRSYVIPSEFINFTGKNLISVRVFDSEISGGIVSGDIGIYLNEDDRDLTINLRGLWDFTTDESSQRNSNNDEFLNTNKHTPSDDAKWNKVMVPGEWEHQGYNNYNGTAWYRKQFIIPKELDGTDLILVLGKIDDFDHAYFNGRWIGSTNYHDRHRIYTIPAELFTGGALNILLVYVKDTQQRGGIYEGPIGLMKQSDFTKYYRNRNR